MLQEVLARFEKHAPVSVMARVAMERAIDPPERLAPVVQAMEPPASLPGWRLRVLDGNPLPASDKRLAPLRGCRGAALPGQALVVCDPDTTLVTDLVAFEDAHAQERSVMPPLLACARAGELWIADRNFCTRTTLARLARRRGEHHPCANMPRTRGCSVKASRRRAGASRRVSSSSRRSA